MVLFSLRYQGIIEDGLTNLIGAFLGATVTVLGAVLVSNLGTLQKRRATRRALKDVSAKINERASIRLQEASDGEPSVSGDTREMLSRYDKDFALAELYILEGILAAGHDVDLVVLPRALRLAAALRHFVDAGSITAAPGPATIKLDSQYRAIRAVGQLRDTAKAVIDALAQ